MPCKVNFFSVVPIASLIAASSTGAEAYIGPGLGVGVIATVLAILGSFLLALFAILWYPAKRLYRRLARSKRKTPQSSAATGRPDGDAISRAP